MNSNTIIVPALTGKFGNWRYYQIILTVEDIVSNFGSSDNPNYRVKSVEEVEEIYSKKGVSELLQRAYDPKRLKPIKNYLLSQNDKYINNLTIGIFGGNPDWINISIVAENDEVTDDAKKKIGFIKLDGRETLFVLDGQHRLKGLRKAFLSNKNKIGSEEIVCTLIIHKPDNLGRIRTRRLFSTINRHAKPVSKGENILLDEDDVSAIVVRDLIEKYPKFKDKEAVGLSKVANISVGESIFTNVVTLWAINEKIIQHYEVYPDVDGTIVRVRPSDNKIEAQRKRVFKFWNKFFELFPSALEFIEKDEKSRKKSRDKGGNYTLRPIAQKAIFQLLVSVDNFESPFLNRLSELPLELSDEFWHYTLWEPHKKNMLSNGSVVLNYIKYNIGMGITNSQLANLTKAYKKNSGELELALPDPLYPSED